MLRLPAACIPKSPLRAFAVAHHACLQNDVCLSPHTFCRAEGLWLIIDVAAKSGKSRPLKCLSPVKACVVCAAMILSSPKLLLARQIPKVLPPHELLLASSCLIQV